MSIHQAITSVTANQKDRRRVREQVRQLRREISPEVRKLADDRICRTFQNLEPFQKANHIAGFLAFDGEADPMQLMLAAIAAGKSVYVPVMIGRHQPLMFSPWSPDAALAPPAVGTSEPTGSPPKLQQVSDVDRQFWKHPHEIDFVIHPLVAFDSHCRRIGMGGGYYDRSFPPPKRDNSQTSEDRLSSNRSEPQLFGFAYEIQLVGSIELNSWDRVLDGVITERKLYRAFRMQ